MEKDIFYRLEKIERKYRNLKFAFIGCIVLSLFGLMSFSFSVTANKQTESFDLIRAKGIIIEDNSGKDRILIGAPIPFSKDRVRTNDELVRKYMAPKAYPQDPEQYMKWYKNYKHSADGIVVMNENGFDRVLVGDKLADPNLGVRMFENAGITWNDKDGLELGGAGVNTLKDGRSRAVIGLDDPSNGGESVHLMSLEDGTKALAIGGEKGRLMIGSSKKDGQWFKNKDVFVGFKFFDPKENLIWEKAILNSNK